MQAALPFWSWDALLQAAWGPLHTKGRQRSWEESMGGRGLGLLPWCLAASLPSQDFGEEEGSALALPPHLYQMTSTLPQPVRLPALLLQHGPGYLPRDEEEDPLGPVWLPQPRVVGGL